ncbi:hypothetical protein Pcinc_016079 [Petrolisthes cinctipes]|uniref:Uncharacterized protein n=1 Tax=Petrolisthes cinctipes TaxID=88211 RepID=A0AAE1FS03_PETCI|nr:hypothetical protein Pcinc_016079 [Petrolisthes cinctipes]
MPFLALHTASGLVSSQDFLPYCVAGVLVLGEGERGEAGQVSRVARKEKPEEEEAQGVGGEDPLAECLPRDLEDPWTRENRFGDPAIFISGSLLISRPGLPFLVISLTP